MIAERQPRPLAPAPRGWFRSLTDSGHDTTDDASLRRQKSVFTGASFLKAGMCPLWCAMFLSVGAWVAAAIPLLYAAVTGLSIAQMARNKDIKGFRSRQAWFIFLAPAGVTLAIGGLHASSSVILWSFLAPVIALLFAGPRSAIRWLLGFFGLVAVSLLVEVLGLLPVRSISLLMLNTFAAMNVVVVTGIVFTAVWYHATLLEEERALQSELNRQLVAKNLELDSLNRRLEEQKRRVEESQRALVQNEKMAALGKLSAGMAHELNNPASAAQRGASHLLGSILELREVSFQLGKASLAPGQVACMDDLEGRAHDRVRDPIGFDGLQRMDREAEIQAWLDGHGLEELESEASGLAELGLDTTEFETLSDLYEPDLLSLVLKRSTLWHTISSLLGEIGQGSSRILGIVKALKSYTYLDQGTLQAVRVGEGLDDTLVMLGGVLKQGVTVTRDYDPDLPCITAHGAELNQVWTNLIDNAVDAMEGSGELTVRTRRDGDRVVVQIIDSGPGVPAGLLDRVFDPFVTSKPVGQGTGLGLNISHHIVVQKHGGAISVDSKPGRTCFEVRLPLHPADCPPSPPDVGRPSGAS